jgi:hypothetical protein
MPNTFEVNKEKKAEAFNAPIRKVAKKVSLPGDDLSSMFSTKKEPAPEKIVVESSESKNLEEKKESFSTNHQNTDHKLPVHENTVLSAEELLANLTMEELQSMVKKKKEKKLMPNYEKALIPKTVTPRVIIMLDYISDYVPELATTDNTFSQMLSGLLMARLTDLSEVKTSQFWDSVNRAFEKVPKNMTYSELRKWITDKRYR